MIAPFAIANINVGNKKKDVCIATMMWMVNYLNRFNNDNRSICWYQKYCLTQHMPGARSIPMN